MNKEERFKLIENIQVLIKKKRHVLTDEDLRIIKDILDNAKGDGHSIIINADSTWI